MDETAKQWLRVTLSEQGLKQTIETIANICDEFATMALNLQSNLRENPMKKELVDISDRWGRDENRLRSCAPSLESD